LLKPTRQVLLPTLPPKRGEASLLLSKNNGVFKRGISPSSKNLFPLSLKGEGDTGGEGDRIEASWYAIMGWHRWR